MRIMAVDLGTKRIGVAISDELHLIARALEIIDIKNEEKTFERIKNLVNSNSVGIIVIGMPLNMDGSSGEKAEDAKIFAEKLQNILPDITIDFFDERLSTIQANNILIEADISRKKRKGITDKLAAQFILQGYLDTKKAKHND